MSESPTASQEATMIVNTLALLIAKFDTSFIAAKLVTRMNSAASIDLISDLVTELVVVMRTRVGILRVGAMKRVAFALRIFFALFMANLRTRRRVFLPDDLLFMDDGAVGEAAVDIAGLNDVPGRDLVDEAFGPQRDVDKVLTTRSVFAQLCAIVSAVHMFVGRSLEERDVFLLANSVRFACEIRVSIARHSDHA